MMTTPCGYVCDNKTSEGYCKTTGCINPKINGSIALKLNSPITEEQWDTITDVDLDNTPKVIFHTKHGKEVEYVKVVRCKDCKFNNRCLLQHFVRDNAVEAITDSWFCADGKRRNG